MPTTTLFDRNTRVQLVRGNPVVNGIDWVEVSGTTLLVHFIHPLRDAVLRPDQVRVDGGESIRDIRVLEITVTGNNVLSATVDRPGDFSTYTVVVDAPGAGIDPPLSRIDFSFRADDASDFDCKPVDAPTGEALPEPRIDYLAKDFASFRQLILDRLATLLPGWTEPNPADFGVALVELLAYVGDYLSYQQDAIATEAYLGTARRRVSARRHAQLVDYQMHDGCNARAWVHVAVTAGATIRRGTQFWTSVAGQQPLVSDSGERDRAISAGATIFEALTGASLLPQRNRIEFHPWGADDAVLPAGSTSATLRDPGGTPGLAPGDVLLLEEVLGPATGRVADADPAHRHAARLTAVTALEDALGDGDIQPLPVLEVQWAAEDALPFALSLQRVQARDPVDGLLGSTMQRVAVARGNLVPVGHGRTISAEQLPTVPQPRVLTRHSYDPLPLAELTRPPRYRPVLDQAPVTHAAPFQPTPPSAAAALRQDVHEAVPFLVLTDGADQEWTARRTLIGSGPDSREFVLEVENDATATLRFGDGEVGRRPEPGTEFSAEYRVGNGSAGNVGADAICHVFLEDAALVGEVGTAPVLAVRNPLPARGGTDQETIDEVRVQAPAALRRRQRRAVTAQDYVQLMTERDDVRGATAITRWTGSSRTVFITPDRAGDAEVDAAFVQELLDWLEPFRLAGHDLQIDRPRRVPLEIAMLVRVDPDFFRSDVRQALEPVFSNRLLPDGRRGLFHPDNVPFGQPVFLSRLIATARGIEGVTDVVITRFQRQGVADPRGLETGQLTFGRLEIPLLDNDPSRPGRGVFRIDLEDGK